MDIYDTAPIVLLIIIITGSAAVGFAIGAAATIAARIILPVLPALYRRHHPLPALPAGVVRTLK